MGIKPLEEDIAKSAAAKEDNRDNIKLPLPFSPSTDDNIGDDTMDPIGGKLSIDIVLSLFWSLSIALCDIKSVSSRFRFIVLVLSLG